MNTKRLIGSRMKQLRKARGLSQEQLAEKIEMSSKYLSGIERGNENPTLETLIKLSQALDFEIFEFFNFSEEKTIKDSKKYLAELIKHSDKERLELAARILKAVYLS